MSFIAQLTLAESFFKRLFQFLPYAKFLQRWEKKIGHALKCPQVVGYDPKTTSKQKPQSRYNLLCHFVFRSEVYGLVLWPLGTYYVGRYIAGELGHGSTFLKYELWKYKTDVQRNAAEKDR